MFICLLFVISCIAFSIEVLEHGQVYSHVSQDTQLLRLSLNQLGIECMSVASVKVLVFSACCSDLNVLTSAGPFINSWVLLVYKDGQCDLTASCIISFTDDVTCVC